MNAIKNALSIPLRIYTKLTSVGNKYHTTSSAFSNRTSIFDQYDEEYEDEREYRRANESPREFGKLSQRFSTDDYRYTNTRERFEKKQTYQNRMVSREVANNKTVKPPTKKLDPEVQREMVNYRQFTHGRLLEIYTQDSENVEQAVSLLDQYRRQVESMLKEKAAEQLVSENHSSQEMNNLSSTSDSSETQKCISSINNETSDVESMSSTNSFVLTTNEEDENSCEKEDEDSSNLLQNQAHDSVQRGDEILESKDVHEDELKQKLPHSM